MTIGELIIEDYRNRVGLRYSPIKCSTAIKGFRWKNCDKYYDWSTGEEVTLSINSKSYNELLWTNRNLIPYYLTKIYNDVTKDIGHQFWCDSHISCTMSPYQIPSTAKVIY